MAILDGFPGVSGATDFAELRRELAGLIVRNSAGVVRAGVFPRSFAPLVTSKTIMGVDVGIFEGICNRNGAVLMVNDASVPIALDAAPVANKRVDVVFFRQRINAIGDTLDGPEINKQTGVAGTGTSDALLASTLAAMNAAFPGAVPIASVEIPSTATTTQSANVIINQIAPYTAAAGGTVAVRTDGELAAWTPHDSSQAYHIAEKRLYERVDSAWLPLVHAISTDYISAATAGAIIGVSGNASLGGVTKTFPNGAWCSAVGSVHIPFSTGDNIAGSLQVLLGSTVIRSRRVHSHGKAASWLSPEIAVDFAIPASAAAQSVTLRLTNDGSSSGGMELWDSEFKVSIF